MNEQRYRDPQDYSLIGKIGLFFFEVIKIALFAGITIGLVRYFLFKPFYVKGQSMEPTYHEREYLIVDEITYRFKDPERGDVLVVRSPISDGEFYLKRIIGLPNERIKLEDNTIIIYNNDYPQGIILDESYLIEETPGSVQVTLGSNEYFVLGDNRDASYDSRRFGPINKDSIIGKTWLRGWPLNKISIIEPPKYNL